MKTSEAWKIIKVYYLNWKKMVKHFIDILPFIVQILNLNQLYLYGKISTVQFKFTKVTTYLHVS